jgi:hypothetical protein
LASMGDKNGQSSREPIAMKRFGAVPTPAGFEAAAAKGNKWLANNPTALRPRNYWSEFRAFLADGFEKLCAYSAMYEPVGTVDHFVSFNENRALAYEWHNYRYASGWINSSKQHLRAAEILDPLTVENEWFEILLPSLQLVSTDLLPPDKEDQAERMLSRLGLGHDERVIRQREEWYSLYLSNDLTLAGLERMAPLIAAAVRKQQRGNDA